VFSGLGVFFGAGGLVGTGGLVGAEVAGGLVGGGDVGATVGGGEVGGGDVGAVLGIKVGCGVAEVPYPGLPEGWLVEVLVLLNNLVGDGDDVGVRVAVREPPWESNAGTPRFVVRVTNPVPVASMGSADSLPGGARRVADVNEICSCS